MGQDEGDTLWFVIMKMVNIRMVRMVMGNVCMNMGMGMVFMCICNRLTGCVGVEMMMVVMPVTVFMRQYLVTVHMGMPFCEQQKNPDNHQY